MVPRSVLQSWQSAVGECSKQSLHIALGGKSGSGIHFVVLLVSSRWAPGLSEVIRKWMTFFCSTYSDEEAIEKGKPATAKLEMLDRVCTELVKVRAAYRPTVFCRRASAQSRFPITPRRRTSRRDTPITRSPAPSHNRALDSFLQITNDTLTSFQCLTRFVQLVLLLPSC